MDTQLAVEEFLKDVCGGKTNETPSAYRGKLQHFIRYIDKMPLSAITKVEFESFRNHLQARKTKQRGSVQIKGPLSPYTIRSILATTRHFLKWSAKRGYLPSDPTDGVKIPQPPPPDPKPVSADTVERLIEVAASTGETWERYRNLAILYVLRDTGGRVGGLVSADVDDLDIKRGRLTVREKGQVSRFLYLSSTTTAAITSWLDERWKLSPSDRKLFTGREGTGLTRKGIYGMLRRMAERAKIAGRSNPHSFRHAFARDGLQNGCDISQISQILGHKNIIVTAAYYARWSDHELKDSHDRYSPVAQMPLVSPNIPVDNTPDKAAIEAEIDDLLNEEKFL